MIDPVVLNPHHESIIVGVVGLMQSARVNSSDAQSNVNPSLDTPFAHDGSEVVLEEPVLVGVESVLFQLSVTHQSGCVKQLANNGQSRGVEGCNKLLQCRGCKFRVLCLKAESYSVETTHAIASGPQGDVPSHAWRAASEGRHGYGRDWGGRDYHGYYCPRGLGYASVGPIGGELGSTEIHELNPSARTFPLEMAAPGDKPSDLNARGYAEMPNAANPYAAQDVAGASEMQGEGPGGGNVFEMHGSDVHELPAWTEQQQRGESKT